MAVINVSVPESEVRRAELVEELVARIKYNVTGAFADVLFDIKHRIEQGTVYADGKIMVVTSSADDPKIADKARVAAVSWSGRIGEVAEEIYWATRSQ